MPRADRKKQATQIVSGSIALVCAMLGVRDEALRPGINSGAIPVFKSGTRRLIFVEDAVAYVRTFPQVKRGPDHAR